MKCKFYIFLTIITFFSLCRVNAQDDLLSELSEDDEIYPVKSTFKGTRLINGHTIETRGAGNLDFLIMHRFGRLNSGIDEFFGLDQAVIRLALDYGITDDLSIGIGRSSSPKYLDGYIKYSFLKQTPGKIPVSATIISSAALDINIREEQPPAEDRLSYATGILIARKFNSAFSFQIAPYWLHRNVVEYNEENEAFALNLATRVKITKRMAITAEYFVRLNDSAFPENTNNAFGVGWELETGGHVFQLIFTNNLGMVENTIIPGTVNDFFSGDIHFGFNISRAFNLKRNKDEKSW
ncbi:DUF5777 family beta-barrel protein [Mangrovivirga sp. M17]|uniref:DUF5777 family beta-barrel protein n=1 Tax=Mangrovivirga halotolerans TaxID=2993936 RepID=A0ABT3RUI3_9BACT|nr:DUF5777 family beta-barrel protein [Mangrovivirga halotolerans]MCX2745290.1 DUF5777 family beta-barrel protein [Mangrovivirga halotolerans]